MSGDFISRDVLMQALKDRFKSRIGASRTPTWNDAFDAVTKLPAADVVEVVHSEWDLDNNEQYAICSSCECCIPMAWSDDEVYWNYCPSCGAKMDGGQDDV